jgi:ribose 5-phosphate isomerase A
MTQDDQKQLVAREALRYVVEDAWLGVGSGSTANHFIDALAQSRLRIRGAVASSCASAASPPGAWASRPTTAT